MSASPKPSSTRPSGFTLTELLIVITLIVIILGIAIPTLSVLTGSRSTESARNQLSAMLGRARGLAIQNGATIGVAIYVDPNTGRTGMALVQMINLSGSTAYQAWTYYDSAAYPMYENGVLNPAGGSVIYQQGDVVFRLADSTGWTSTNANFLKDPTESRKTVKTFVCSQNHTAAGPPNSGNAPGTSGGDPYWNWMPPNSIDLVQGGSGDVELLPKGVAVELINDSASSIPGSTLVDQYVHTGIILFDSTGKLTVGAFFIVPGSSLYSDIVSSNWPGTPLYIPQININNQQLIYSSVGVALYDSSAIVDQPFYTSNTATTAADLTLQMTASQVIPTQAIKTQLDSWVSSNAQLFFVSRDSGALQKAE